MEGLEISEKFLSETSHELDDVFRIDAEHYQHHYQINDAILRKHQFNFLRNLVMTPVVTGHTPSMMVDGFYYGDIPFIKTDNLRENKIIKEFNHYLSQEGAEQLKGSALSASDIITTIIGATYSIVGRTAILQDGDLPANINQNIARIRPNQKKISPHYLNIFLNSKHGRLALHYHSRQTEQVNLNCREVERVIVPLFPFLPTKIEVLVFSALDYARKSSITYTKAETLLLNALGVADFSPSTKSVNIKSFTESFAATGRLDAEHYQAQYDDIEAKIKAYKGGFTTIGTLTHNIMNGAEVREYQAEGVAYLRVGDLKQLDIDADSVVRIAPEAAEKGLEKIPLQAGDVLVSRSGSLAVTAVVEPAWKNALISSHLIRLRIADRRIDPYFLALYLSCLPGKKQILKWSNGGVQPEISQPALKAILVPIVDADIQKEIRTHILDSRRLRQTSARLLDVAKRAVEIAIEQDEEAGMAYIQEHTKGYDL